MAEIAGYGGGMAWGTDMISDDTHNVSSWSLTLEADLPEVTTFTDAGWRTYIKGLKGWTASVEAFVDGTNEVTVAEVGSDATLALYVNATKYYSGTAFLRSFNPTVNVDGVATQTLEFTGSGSLAYN